MHARNMHGNNHDENESILFSNFMEPIAFCCIIIMPCSSCIYRLQNKASGEKSQMCVFVTGQLVIIIILGKINRPTNNYRQTWLMKVKL